MTSVISRAPLGRFARPMLLPILLVAAGLLSACASPIARTPLAGLPESGNPYRSGLHEYVQGNHAWALDDAARASLYFAEVLDYDPGNPIILRRAFELAVSGGDFPLAFDLGERLVSAEPSLGTLNLLFVAQALREKDYGDATQAIDRTADAGFEAILSPIVRAWIAYGRGQREDARALLSVDGRDGLIESYQKEHLAYILLASGETSEAVALLRSIIGPGSNVGARLKLTLAAAAQRQDGKADALEVLAPPGATPSDPRLIAAIDRVERGRSLSLPIRTPAQGVAELLLRAAADLSSERPIPLALVYARLSTYLDPSLEEARLLTAEILRQFGDSNGALELLDSFDPQSALLTRARSVKAAILLADEETDAAISLLNDAAQANPDLPDVWVELGDAYRSARDFPSALAAYDRAVENLGSPEERHWVVYYLRGVAHERTKNWQAAEDDFRKALTLRTDEPNVLNYLGYSWLEQGRNIDEATQMIQRAVDQRPDDGFIIDSLGWAYYVAGDYERAVALLEQAVYEEPGDPTINEHLGDAYWRVGRQIESRFRWNAALKLDPDEEQVARLRYKQDFGLDIAYVDAAAAGSETP